MGVQEMTRFGMKEKDFGPLAGLIADVIMKNRNVKEEVKKLRSQFSKMEYCLTPEQAIPFVAKIFSSIFPDIDYFKLFVENLENFIK
jgi:hypothetical protein